MTTSGPLDGGAAIDRPVSAGLTLLGGQAVVCEGDSCLLPPIPERRGDDIQGKTAVAAVSKS